MSSTKSELRDQARLRRVNRLSLPPTPKLVQYLIDTFPEGSNIGCYLNIAGEISTGQLINSLLSNFSLYGPAVVDKTILWRKLDGNTALGRFDIPEPISAEEINKTEIHCFILPALAADKSGNRLGFGAGYFDRNLAQTKADKIVLIFDEDLVSKIPAEPHDVKVDLIATQSRLIKTKD